MDDTSESSPPSPYDYYGPPTNPNININRNAASQVVASTAEGRRSSLVGDETYVKKSDGTPKRVAKKAPLLEPASKRQGPLLLSDLPSSGSHFADDSGEEIPATLIMDMLLLATTLPTLPQVGAYIVTNNRAESPLSSLSGANKTTPDSSEDEYDDVDVPLVAAVELGSPYDNNGDPPLSNEIIEGDPPPNSPLSKGDPFSWSDVKDSVSSSLLGGSVSRIENEQGLWISAIHDI
jgi:hypothetical protein